MNRVYLVRHGENRANLTKEFSYKKVDYPLTAKGVLQAHQTGEHFKGKEIHEIYSSPLKRAQQTAKIIAGYLDMRVSEMEIFREVNVGSLECHPDFKEAWEINHRIVKTWMGGQPEEPYPDGENLLEIQQRMRAGIEQVVRGKIGRNILIVAHGGIFTFSLSGLCPEIDAESLINSENHNCSITEIEAGNRNGDLDCQMVSWASHTHLRGEAAKLVSAVFKDGEDPSRAAQGDE
jgi:broad specificity phosphatase PhoE